MHHIRHDHECGLGPRGSFLHRKTTDPKEWIAKRKTKVDNGTTPPPKKSESSKPLKNTRQVDKCKTDTAGLCKHTAGLSKLRDDIQNVPLLFPLLPNARYA